MKRAIASAVALVALVAAGWSLLRPPSLDVQRLWAWAAAVGPARTVASAVWLVAVALGGYLTLVGMAMGICRCFGCGRAVAALARLVPGPFRLVLPAVVGLSAAVAGTATPGGASTVPRPPVLQPAPDGRVAGPPRVAVGAPVLRRLPDVSSATTTAPPAPAVRSRNVPTTSVGPALPAPPAAPVALPRPATRTWVIRPGDHLWLVAQQTLTAAWGRTPESRAVARYWWKLVQLNRPYLPDPDDADLVFPGDAIMLPPIPAD